ncbi:unnamed protein product [Schistosoma mattheei]|uniref:Uncharacterized protein n=1 Tax=Schistosoma mattheei TaxID=31246 RepID=A0AA85ASJ9_9TREM|nr:unnamed protein product [Schistosoma mattheei]
MQCLEDEHSCITNISYTIPPYWSPMGERTHFLWKACISTEECERQKKLLVRLVNVNGIWTGDVWNVVKVNCVIITQRYQDIEYIGIKI